MKSINKIFEITAFFTSFSFEWNNGFAYDGESHNFWEIVYVQSGEVGLEGAGVMHQMKAGEMIFHKPNEYVDAKTLYDYCDFLEEFISQWMCEKHTTDDASW